MHRFIRVATIVTALSALTASPALAAPTISLTWVESSNPLAVTGGSTIDASVGDVLTLLITISSDAAGLSYTNVSLDWDGGDLTGANAIECPEEFNMFGSISTCTPNGGPIVDNALFNNILEPGVVIDNVAGEALGFTAASIPGVTGFFDLFTGTIEFTVEAGADPSELVEVFYRPVLDEVDDNDFNVFFPTAAATIIVPEPGTAGLVGLGLLALGVRGRRRGQASRGRRGAV